MTEREPPHYQHHDRPRDLPPELVEALGETEYACLTFGTEIGTAILLKAPAIEIASIHDRVPIGLSHELYEHPNAPVIRIGLRIYDQPQAPLSMETFINVADAIQRHDYAALAEQDTIPLLCFDETLIQRRTMLVTHSSRDVVPAILAVADELRSRIPDDRYDFERAKQDIMEGTRL